MAEHRQSRVAGVLLLAGLLVSALSQNHKVGFELGHHGFLSSHGATLARNLSPRTGFLLFNRVTVGADGEREFEAYGGFPMYPFAMIGSIMALFPNRLGLQVYAARQLMNLFCWGALVVSYLLLLRLTGSRWRALAASFIAFSSAYLSYYNDMIFNDVPALFGSLLLLLDITHRLTGGGRPLLLYAAVLVAVSLGWRLSGFSAASG